MRKVSQQRKFKKYNNLKHKPKSTNQTRVQEEQEDLPLEKTEKTLYKSHAKDTKHQSCTSKKKTLLVLP